MSITIHIGSEFEQRLHQLSSKKGLEVEHFIQQIIKEQVENTPTEEEELIEKINTGVSVDKWQRFFELKAKREAITLTEAEHLELIEVFDEIELVHSERMLHLVELSKIRNVSVLQLMDEFGIKPKSDA